MNEKSIEHIVTGRQLLEKLQALPDEDLDLPIVELDGYFGHWRFVWDGLNAVNFLKSDFYITEYIDDCDLETYHLCPACKENAHHLDVIVMHCGPPKTFHEEISERIEYNFPYSDCDDVNRDKII